MEIGVFMSSDGSHSAQLQDSNGDRLVYLDATAVHFGTKLPPQNSLFSLVTHLITKYSLQLKKLFQPGLAPLPAIARLFVTSKTPPKVDSRAVDVHVACSNSLGHAARAFDVSRSHET